MRKLRILEIASQYDVYLSRFYRKHPEAAKMSYDDLYQFLVLDCNAECDFLHRYLREMGHSTKLIFFNNRLLQGKSHLYREGIDWIELLCRQVREFDPEVLYITDLFAINKEVLNQIKAYIKRDVCVVGYHFSDITESFVEVARELDQVYTGNEHYACDMRKMGIQAYSVPHAFMGSILDKIDQRRDKKGICFCGSIMLFGHKERLLLMDALDRGCREYDAYVDIYGREKLDMDLSVPQKDRLSYKSIVDRIEKKIQPSVFGMEYYQCLSDHKICINLQGGGDERRNYGNMRVYEVTGTGSCLLTDYREGLEVLFDAEKEIVVYHDFEEMKDRIRWLNDNEEKRSKIAKAGQKKTLTEYTYKNKSLRVNALLQELF